MRSFLFSRWKLACGDLLITALQTEPCDHMMERWLIANRLLIYRPGFCFSVSDSPLPPPVPNTANPPCPVWVIFLKRDSSIEPAMGQTVILRDLIPSLPCPTTWIDTAISHSVALPDPFMGQHSCGLPLLMQSQLEARGHLSYLWSETRFRKSKSQISGDSPQRTIHTALFSRLPRMLNSPRHPDNRSLWIFNLFIWTSLF